MQCLPCCKYTCIELLPGHVQGLFAETLSSTAQVPREAQAPHIREDDPLPEPQGLRGGTPQDQGPLRHQGGGSCHEGGGRSFRHRPRAPLRIIAPPAARRINPGEKNIRHPCLAPDARDSPAVGYL